jgi:hypothetical protein
MFEEVNRRLYLAVMVEKICFIYVVKFYQACFLPASYQV